MTRQDEILKGLAQWMALNVSEMDFPWVPMWVVTAYAEYDEIRTLVEAGSLRIVEAGDASQYTPEQIEVCEEYERMDECNRLIVGVRLAA